MRAYLILILTGLLSFAAWSDDLDELQKEVDYQAIIQLEKTLNSIDDSNPSKAKIYIRIGDLYAEKGRHLFEQEIETKKKLGSAQARQSSIRSFLNAIKLVNDPETIATIKLRTATIYTEVDDTKKALALISEVIDDKNTPQALRHSAYFHRGHGYFTAGDFAKALNDYNNINLAKLDRDDQIYILYRKGWSLSQLNQHNEAKAAFKQALTLVTASKSKIGQDIYIDYAALILKENSTTTGEIRSLILNAQKEYQLTLMIEIAGEAYRLGRLDIAKDLYRDISNHSEATIVNKSIAKLRLLIINGNHDTKQKEQAMNELMTFAKRCSDSADCQLIKKEIRYYVLQTHRLKKTNPDQTVLNTYNSYLAVYKDETSLFIAAAEVANYLDQHDESAKLYEEAINLEKNSKNKEQYLKSNLSRAEASGIANQKKQAYLLYLQQGQDQQTKSELIFELAKTEYQLKNYLNAYDLADQLALDQKTNLALRTKASLLAIDALLKTQNHELIAKAANRYAKIFKTEESKFEEIATKAETALLVSESQNAKDQSLSKSRNQIQNFKTLYQRTSNTADKTNLVKNMIRISQDSGLTQAHQEALFLLIALPSVSQSEKKSAVEELYNLHLKQMEFNAALELVTKFPQFLNLNIFEKAQLADMAQNKSIMLQSYNQCLKDKKTSNSHKAFAALRIVTFSKDPAKEFKKQLPYLELDAKIKEQAQFFTGLQLFKSQWIITQKINKNSKLNLLKNRIQNLARLIDKAKLQVKPKITHNTKSLEARQKRLNDLDAELQISLNQKDLLSQTMWLIAIQNENQIFVTEISQLELPKGIKKEQISDYQNQLKQLSKPYLEKSLMAQKKLVSMNEELSNFMIKEREQLGIEAQDFFEQEITVLKAITQSHGYRWSTRSIEQVWTDRLSEWKNLKRKMDNKKASDANFISLETQFGNPVLVSFLKEKRGQNE